MRNSKGHCVPGRSNNTGKYAAAIIDECAAMNPQVNESAKQSFTQRLQLCINFNGQHFEQLF
jgi:hypothetical protein